MRRILAALTAIFVFAGPLAAWSRTILISNDDGLTSNVLALYRALKAHGDDVIVSVPCTDQSGSGAAIRFGKPLGPLAAACRAGAAAIGDPGAGPMIKAGFGADFSYVEGTPVMAVLYGLDVAAVRRWGRPPDLVLSGPNEGRNVGGFIIASGTVGVAQFAALRGVPAIALSAGANTSDKNGVDNPASIPVARLATQLVADLEQQSGGGWLLPPSLVLNVNFPDQVRQARWRLAKVGDYEGYVITFEDPGLRAPAATPATGGAPDAHYLGVHVGPNLAAAKPDQMDDEAVVARSDMSISVLQVGGGASAADLCEVQTRLEPLTRTAPVCGRGR